MTHRSKLSQIVIDCADLDVGLAFWGGALGLPAAAAWIEEPYGTLGDIGGLHIVVQRVPEPKTAKSRIHLDIETDDIEAEVRRLEALGARRAARGGARGLVGDARPLRQRVLRVRPAPLGGLSRRCPCVGRADRRPCLTGSAGQGRAHQERSEPSSARTSASVKQ
jgi:catechol 2,3-dioxygenase-like lactoylglutathione lyase family enzyme